MIGVQRAIYYDGNTYLVGDIIEVTYEMYDADDILVNKTVCGKIKTLYDKSVDIDCSEKFESKRMSIDIVCILDIRPIEIKR